MCWTGRLWMRSSPANTWQVFTLDLFIDGEAFHAQIEIRYLPAPDQWYLSIWDHALGKMLVNQIPLICSYEQLNDLLMPFRHLRDGKGMGSLFCLHPSGRNGKESHSHRGRCADSRTARDMDNHSVPAEHGTGVTVPLFRADPAKGNLTEFQVLWGDTWTG